MKVKQYLERYIRALRRDRRHIVCLAITVVSVAFIFIFPNGIPRVGEACRDVGTSFFYYFYSLFANNPDSCPVRPTVLSLPSWQFAASPFESLHILPDDWEAFCAAFKAYWLSFASKDNLIGYISFIGELLSDVSFVLMLALPLVIPFVILFGRYTKKICTERGKQSAPLRAYRKLAFGLHPFIRYIKDLASFARRSNYVKIWTCIWLVHFNVVAIGIECLAYLLYITASLNFVSLYGQVLKLLEDLTPVIRFIPGILWLTLAIFVYNAVCRYVATKKLYYYESCNRSFLRERGIVTTVYGVMGSGKTSLITSMALSAEIEQFDMAYDIMLEVYIKFPNFNYTSFRDELKKRIERREIVDLPSCRKWIEKCGAWFDYIKKMFTPGEWRERRKILEIKNDYTFGYDFEHYPTVYNDELKLTTLFEALSDYACAYLIFTVKTTLLFSNYSIRTDSLIEHIGNMPRRNNDFLTRPVEYQEACSVHAHIIDMDMLRLGRKMVKDNPKARRLSFGVYVITEIDKEFKNMQELKEVKMTDKEANQRNDLHNACLMMSRHAAVVANRVFIRIICDLQRPEAWGAGGRELGEVVYISDKSAMLPSLPFFSPYWLLSALAQRMTSKWRSFHEKYSYSRSDETLFTHLWDNCVSAINHHYDRVEGAYGVQTLKLEVMSGTLDGNVKHDKWRLINKKDRARRYRTDCLESVFSSVKPNYMHIDDFVTYAGVVGTQDENIQQNSYFQNDVKKMKELN